MKKPFDKCTGKILSLAILTLLFAIASSMHAHAIHPETPIHGGGGYYVLPELGSYTYTVYVTAMYDDTDICHDSDHDLECESNYELDSNGRTSFSSTGGDMLFTDKPVLVTSYYRASSDNGYSFQMLPVSMSAKDYYLSGLSSTYIIATQYGTTNITINKTGGVTYQTLTYPSQSYNDASPGTGTRITSNKPIMVMDYYYYANHGFGRSYGIQYLPSSYLGTEYYSSGLGSTYVTATQDSTTVWVDQDRDGLTDSGGTYNLNWGDQQSLGNLLDGAKITSGKTVLVTNYYYSETYQSSKFYHWQTPKAKSLGIEFFLSGLGSGLGGVYVTSALYNTNITIDNTTDTWSETLSAPEDHYHLTTVPVGTRITASKPVLVTSYYYPADDAYAFNAYPLTPSVFVSQTPRLMALGEIANISADIFNPTSEILHNSSLYLNVTTALALQGSAGKVNLTVYRKWASNDTIIMQTEFPKDYTTVGGGNEFNVSISDNETIFSQLPTDQYIHVDWRATANSEGYYTVDVTGNYTSTSFQWA